MHGFAGHVHSNAVVMSLCGVTRSTQNMNANLFEWAIIWMVLFCKLCVILIKSMIIVAQFCKKNSFMNDCVVLIWQLMKFMTVILTQFHHCNSGMCELLNLIILLQTWFFMHCSNHHSDSQANHVILYVKKHCDKCFTCIYLHESMHLECLLSALFNMHRITEYYSLKYSANALIRFRVHRNTFITSHPYLTDAYIV